MTKTRQLVLGPLMVSIDAAASADALFAQLAQLSHALTALHSLTARAGPPAALPDARLIELSAAYEGVALLLRLADFVEEVLGDHEESVAAQRMQPEVSPAIH